MNLVRTNPVLPLLSALALGVLGDQLLREHPWGMNVALWVLVAAALTSALARGSGNPLPTQRLSLLAASVVFASFLLWRAAPELAALSLLGAFAAAVLAMIPRTVGDMRRAHLLQIASGSAMTLFDAALGVVPLLANDIATGLASSLYGLKRAYAVARGALLSLPLLLVVGSLFVSADATFQHLVEKVLDIDIVKLLDHMLLIGCLTWPLAGVFRGHILAGHRMLPECYRPQGLWLQFTEVGIVLGSLSLLSVTFIVTQFLYLFGGSAYVLGAPSLTLAEYARRGFFELVGVVLFVLPVMLAAEWLLRKDSPRSVRWFRALAGFQIALLTVLMLSAIHRLVIYQSEFGLTQLRLYAAAVLLWLALVLAWFVLTVLRGRRERFALGTLVAAAAVLATLQVVNPDDLIVRVNMDRYRAGKPLDVGYLTVLGADAAPALIGEYNTVPMPERGRIAASLLRMESAIGEEGPLTWNRARSLARAAIASRAADLQRDAACASGAGPGPEPALCRPPWGGHKRSE